MKYSKASTLAMKNMGDAANRHGARRTLYINATIITVNETRDVILNGAILTNDNYIEAVDKTSKLLPEVDAETRVIDLEGHIIIPGLINTHAHLAQSILRGLAENLSLHSWLCDAIWPLEAAYAADDGYVAARLTIAEMLLSGTTCFLEAMCTATSNIDNVVRAVYEMGIRGCVGKLIKSTETNPALNMRDARDKDVASMSVQSALDAHSRHNLSSNERIQIWFAAGTPRGSPLEAHAKIGETARQHDIGITMHCAEAPDDLMIYRKEYQGRSPLQFCEETSLTSHKTVLAHVVHPDPSIDFEILRRTKTTVSHNPTSNCKLGSGIAPIPEMLEAGVNVTLGTDGAPCNNTYDMFREMHLAAILHSGHKQKAGIIDAYTILEMATIRGARALGLEDCIGSLKVGKKADFVAIETSNLACAPWDSDALISTPSKIAVDPVTTVVHSCAGSDVSLVVVDGKILVENGSLKGIDISGIRTAAIQASKEIIARSDLVPKGRLALNYL